MRRREPAGISDVIRKGAPRESEFVGCASDVRVARGTRLPSYTLQAHSSTISSAPARPAELINEPHACRSDHQARADQHEGP